jgi:hypothetical protein
VACRDLHLDMIALLIAMDTSIHLMDNAGNEIIQYIYGDKSKVKHDVSQI